MGNSKSKVWEDEDAAALEPEAVPTSLDSLSPGNVLPCEDEVATPVESAGDDVATLDAELDGAVDLPCATLESPDAVAEDAPVEASLEAGKVASEELAGGMVVVTPGEAPGDESEDCGTPEEAG